MNEKQVIDRGRECVSGRERDATERRKGKWQTVERQTVEIETCKLQ